MQLVVGHDVLLSSESGRQQQEQQQLLQQQRDLAEATASAAVG